MMKAVLQFFLLTLLILVFPHYLQAQKNEKGCTEYETRLAKAEKLYEEGKYLESTSWYISAAEAEKKAVKPNLLAIAKSYGNAAYSFDLANNPEKALEFYHLTLDLARRINDSTEISINLANIGQSYVLRGKFELALQYVKEALLIEKLLKNDEGISINLNSIGKIFESCNRPYDAINFYKQALEIDRKDNVLPRMAIRLSSLGSVYRSLKDYPTALQYQNQALEIEKKLGKPSKIAIRLDRIGEIYLETGKYSLAEQYFTDALIIFRRDSNQASIANVLQHLGNSKLKQQHYAESQAAYTECIALAEKLHLVQVQMKALSDISVLYNQTRDYSKALFYLQQYIILKDSVFTKESQAQIMEFREKYETEKKEKEIAILTREKELNRLKLYKNKQQKIFLAGGGILLVFILLLTYSRYRIKINSNRLLEEKNRELKLLNDTKNRFFAIIAHDMKNPVSAFRNITGSMVRNFESMSETELKYFINELNLTAGNVKDLLQNLLEWARSQLNTLNIRKEDIKLQTVVDNALKTIEMSAKDKNITLDIVIDQDFTLNTDAAILSTVLRNLLSNAVKFTGIKGRIEIGSQKNNTHINLWVSDNGSGMSEADVGKLFRIDSDVRTINPGPDKGSGLGLILCRELIIKVEGDIKVESILGKGSKFIITLPI